MEVFITILVWINNDFCIPIIYFCISIYNMYYIIYHIYIYARYYLLATKFQILSAPPEGHCDVNFNLFGMEYTELPTDNLISRFNLHSCVISYQKSKLFAIFLNFWDCANIGNLADASSFCHTASPQVWSNWDSKPSKHYYGFKWDPTYKS